MARPVSHHDNTCIDGGDQTTIQLRFPPGSGATDFQWAPLPPAGSAYSFALDEAIIVLSPACAAVSGLQANADDGPGTARSLWLGRLSEAPSLKLAGCGCGAVVFLSGSGGMTGDNLRYARHLAALGYSVLAPDTMAERAGLIRDGGSGASPPSSWPRRRPLVPRLSEARPIRGSKPRLAARRFGLGRQALRLALSLLPTHVGPCRDRPWQL